PPPVLARAWRIDLPECPASSLDQVRVGTWFDAPECPLDSEYRARLGAMAGSLSDAGANIDDGPPPGDFGAQGHPFFRMVGAAASPSAPDAVAEVSAGSHRAWLRAEEERA